MDRLLYLPRFRIPRPQIYTKEELKRIAEENDRGGETKLGELTDDGVKGHSPVSEFLDNGNIEITEIESDGNESPTLKHSGDRHNKRYYSDPMHHIPKEQQKSVETKKKSSEKLYQLKSELVRPETIEPEGDVIIVYKHKPTLGIAIEGGANTRQPLPRIINIQPGGSAHESGGLKVGHVILEIDGHSMSGLEHKQAARLIAESFKNKRTAQMEFVVCEDKEISL